MALLNQLNLVVSDMEASLAFYRRLGVDIGPTSPEWAAHHRSASGMADGLDLDLDSETFARQWDGGWPGGTGVVIGFRAESRAHVDELYTDLTGAGYTGQQPPYDAFWGARYAVVSDPDGNAVGLMSPVDPARRSPVVAPSSPH